METLNSVLKQMFIAQYYYEQGMNLDKKSKKELKKEKRKSEKLAQKYIAIYIEELQDSSNIIQTLVQIEIEEARREVQRMLCRTS